MNKLEAVILDQHARVRAAGANPLEALTESQGEIMEVATPELTLDIIRAQDNPSRSIVAIRNADRLARTGMIIPNQGYTGGILFDHGEAIVYGQSARFDSNGADPVQQAMRETFYPPMMWAKALRAEAYKNRPDSARQLSAAEYLASLGLSLGSMVSSDGDIVGATGFMPGPRLWGELDDSTMEHARSESIEAFRLSGLCDQAVLEPDILLRDPSQFAASILALSGSLN